MLNTVTSLPFTCTLVQARMWVYLFFIAMLIWEFNRKSGDLKERAREREEASRTRFGSIFGVIPSGLHDRIVS